LKQQKCKPKDEAGFKMLRRASIILAETRSGGSILILTDYRGGLFGGIFFENRVPSATCFMIATYACVGKRGGSVSILPSLHVFLMSLPQHIFW
jgi:hypothetical protein